ncbi:uncharacterized protein LOC110455619 [Mizuhopecten yessoensis]|nr:uncharacterized protein LOC110455619 [Mizuhopecten yessoensis]
MTIKKRRNRFLLCGSGSSGTVSPRSSPSNSSSTISTSSGYVSLRLGFSTRLKIFFRRILSRFRSNRRRIHPKRQSSISLMEDHSLSIIMELPEHSESSLVSGTQIAPSPPPLSSGVQNMINQLSEKQPMSCSSRGSVQSLWSENENVSPTAADLSPQPPSISNMFDVANLSPEALEKTLVNQQINPYDEHKEASSESMEVNKAYCRNENAKQREKPMSLISSTASCELPGAMGTVVEKTNCCTTTVKMENRTESKSVQFQNNVIVYPSPSGVVDTNSSSGQMTVECLSDLRSEGLRVGEDCKARRPATPGKLLNEGETTASQPLTPAPMNEGKKTVSPPQTSTYVTVKDPDYTPRTPRNTVKPESDKGKTNTSLPQCTASSQQTKTLIEESKGDLYVKEVGNSSTLDNDIPPEEVCAKRSWSRLDLSTYPTNDDCFRTSEKVLSGEERNEKVRKNMSDVNVVDTDRQELEEKARRRADRKKRKEMRMAAEGYIKEQENLPQEEKRKLKKKAKKKNIQKKTAINSEEPAGQKEYRHQRVMRLEAERDTTNLNGQEGSDGTVTFEDKLLHWEKMKTTGDNRSLDGQEETNKPARKTRTKKKKNRELPAAGDEGMGTEKAKRKERTHMEHDVNKEDILGSGEETGECIEPIEHAMHPHKKPHKYNESRYREDTVLKHSSDDEIHTYHVDHSKIYCEDNSKIGQADSNFLDEIGKEKLSQEERRKKQTKRKKMKEAIAAGNEHSNDMRKEYPDDQVITQMSREDNDYQREHVTDQDKIEGMQQEIAEILGLSSNSDQAQRIKHRRGMVNKDTNHIFKDEQGCENSGNQKSEDFEALRYERDSAIGFQNEKGNAKSKSKLMNFTCGERIQQQKSRQKRKVKNLNDDQLSSAVFTSENPIIHDGYPVITDSVSPQTVMNEDVLDVNPIPLTSSYESNAPVQSESNKKYVHAGVGPTHSEDVSQKAVHVAKTKPVTVASGERRRKSSNKNRDNRDNSTTDEVSSTYVKGHKQSPGGQHIGQQYSVDHQHVSLYPEEEEDDHTVNFHKDLSSQVSTWAPGNQPRMQDRVQTAENYLLMAKQDSSLETPGIGGNRKGHFNEEDRVTHSSSTYPRERDASNHINITTRDGDLLPTAPTSPESDEDRQREQVSSHQDVKDHYLSITELDRPRPVGCDVDIDLGREMKPGLESAVRRMNQLG